MAVLLYCDYSQLSFQFSSTFRRKHAHESNADLKARNREFWHLSKTLMETVELFGSNVSDR
eukprot:CAMPEP_0202725652 /NCGR_PEP_ID=MMETSP1385-20130828/183946_1 /ASSEMBLY_ACC=CAM_ASM_000861 /TAXON_ID=933848 /ORGANISM="Elphidium margaritaceum" /LENGTH=60 /DNA_ID=CAMNT_0049391833 /DNA_START=49 /DNA_END=227 /DNA_ORIENTATION=-